MQHQNIPLEQISIYGGTQTRAATNDEAIEQYAEDMEAGAQFPPIIVFYDGSKYWLADGFHRYLAAKRNDYEDIAAEVREGGRSSALELALGANATNGLFRTAADKRHSVEVALEEWPDKSNAVLADLCRVSVEFVRKQRQKTGAPIPPTVTGKDGKQYPARIEREPRGGGSGGEGGGSGGGGGGKPGKKSAAAEMAYGGSSKDLEIEAADMERKGEISFLRPGDPMPTSALGLARMAIASLDKIRENDPDRLKAYRLVEDWLSKRAGLTETAALAEDAGGDSQTEGEPESATMPDGESETDVAQEQEDSPAFKR
jgi:uncharacterized ParB-like nuclease family protein